MIERCRSAKIEKGTQRAVKEAAGGGLYRYTCLRVGSEGEAISNAIPDVAGVERGKGAAKPDGVIQRCYMYHQDITNARTIHFKQEQN
jgi:hypothetical protein